MNDKLKDELIDEIKDLLVELAREYGPEILRWMRDEFRDWIAEKRAGKVISNERLREALERFQAKWPDPKGETVPEPTEPPPYGKPMQAFELADRVAQFADGDQVWRHEVRWQGSVWIEYVVVRPGTLPEGDDWELYAVISGGTVEPHR